MEIAPTLERVTEIFNQFSKDWQQVQDDSAKFAEITGIYCGIINKVPLEFIPFYVDEYYMKVAAVYDAVDTLEFGKMRSDTQKLLHKQFVSRNIRGGFLAGAYEGEKDIALSFCSHEGLTVQLRLLKKDLERSTDDHTDPTFVAALDKIDDLDNRIAVASRDINMYRLKIINLSKESLQTALHKSQNRRFCLNADSYYMDGKYGCFEGFKCEYYKKASGKEKKVNYKVLLYSALEAAHFAGRDLYAEIRSLIVPSAPNYAHDELLVAYRASQNDAAASSRQLKEHLAEHAAELKAQRVKSKLILQAREEEMKALTDPEAIRERDEEAAAHVALMKSIVGGVRVAGDSSDDQDSSDSDRSSIVCEEETAPQTFDVRNTNVASSSPEKTKAKSKKPVSKIKHSTSNKRGSNTSSTSSTVVHSSNFTTQNKKYRRYGSLTSRGGDDDYSSTDSELGMSDDPPSTHCSPNQHIKPPKKRARGSAFLEPSSSPLESHHSSTPPVYTTSVSSEFGGVSQAPNSMSALEIVNSSVCNNLKSKKRGLSRHLIDNSVIAEYDPTFPELDGHPHNDSLLHEIDERLVHVDSDEEAEMEDEDHHTVNVAWNLQHGNSPLTDTENRRNKKQATRSVNPEKVRKQQAAQDAAAAKKEEKRLDAKAKRQEAVFQRRVLEANNGHSSQRSETDEDQNSSSRKRRATSGISASWTGFYGVNLALNQAQMRNSALITGCADHVLGSASSASSSSSSSESSTLPRTDVDYSVVLSYRKQSGAVCDRVLKQKLMKHLQLDIFKEITFERLITEYSVAKRESVGVADDEIIDIDWFEVMDGFSVNLKSRLSVNSRIILGRIHTAIDDDDSITAKFAMKERFTKSMNAFLRHGYRTINSIITKTVHKIGAHFDSLNFSDALPRYDTFSNKTQGYAFSFTASLYNVFDENTAALTTGGDMLGVDPLLCEIMKSSTNESHMADVIEYSLIKKSKYTDSPASYTALRKYLEKRKGTVKISSAKDLISIDNGEGQPNNRSSASTANSSLNTTLSLTDNNSTSSFVREELWSTNITTPSHHSVSSHNTTNETTTTPSNNVPLLPTVSTQSNNNNVNKQLFTAVDDGGDMSPSNDLKQSSSHTCATNSFINKYLPIVIDDADKVAKDNPSAASICTQVVTKLRQFLLLFLSDMKHHDNSLCLKLNTKHNTRVTRNLSLMKFLEDNMDLDDVALYDVFCTSPYFKSLSCVMLIPFSLEDQYNIIGDGYCFYRSLFILSLRDESGHRLSAEELKAFDLMLKSSGEEGDKLRTQFQDFLTRLEDLFPDPKAKAKVAAASCTFTNLKTYLDERFWGGSDSVPFLDFACTAFSYSKEESLHLTGCWAKMYCSSVPGMVNGRDTVNYNDVGSAYSLSDVLAVVMRPHNWLLHKQVHFFIADHPSVETHLKAFSAQMSSILSELRLRLAASKGEDSDVTFTEVYNRMVSGSSTPEDVVWLAATTNSLERQLTEQNFLFGEEDEEDVVAPPVTAPKKIETFLATPFGATQEQKIYISTINNTVAVKESENELLRTQLAGLKEMIARNSASVKCPIFIDCNV